METDPLSIILVKGDSKGDRLLFRYPFEVSKSTKNEPSLRRKNPYSVIIKEDMLEGASQKTINIENGRLVGFTDEVLSNLFAVKQELREKKFELKTNDVRFVGHPSIIRQSVKKDETNPSTTLVNIVFALRAIASHSIVRRYHELSKRLGAALIAEENKCGYFSHEMKIMISAHDEFTRSEEDGVEGLRNPFHVILERSSLAHDLKRSYDDLCTHGLVQFKLNKSTELSFCLPQKVHQLHNKALRIEPELIDRCFESLRPYHGLLLLLDTRQLLKSLSPEASPSLSKLIKVYTPLKSFETLGADSGLAISEVVKMVGHLVYWGKAIVIYPLCESNVYIVAPNAPIHNASPFVEKFADRFPHHSLIEVMSEYSLPLSLKQKLSPLSMNHETDVQIVIWLLQHRLLMQLHTYIYYMPTDAGLYSMNIKEKKEYTENKQDNQIFGLDNKDNLVSSKVKGGTLRLSEDEELTSIEEEGEESSSWSEEGLTSTPTEHSGETPPLPPGAFPRDFTLLNNLIRKGYFQGKHHLEDIMFQENLKRSELLQLLDKFRDVLVTCEAEDPIISLFYPHYYETS